jgi:hypothetical protein
VRYIELTLVLADVVPSSRALDRVGFYYGISGLLGAGLQAIEAEEEEEFFEHG